MSWPDFKHVIYPTRVEYGEYKLEAVRGCVHNCRYCFARTQALRFGWIKSAEEWCQPVIVSDVMEKLKRDITGLKRPVKDIMMSFHTDPFQRIMGGKIPRMSTVQLHKEIMGVLIENRLPFSILTKSCDVLNVGVWNFPTSCRVGFTIVTLRNSTYEEWEGGSHPLDRVVALKDLHEAGVRTFASVEPIIPDHHDEAIQVIHATCDFTDFYYVGKMNYMGRQDAEYWGMVREKVVDALESLGCKYLLKKELKEVGL